MARLIQTRIGRVTGRKVADDIPLPREDEVTYIIDQDGTEWKISWHDKHKKEE